MARRQESLHGAERVRRAGVGLEQSLHGGRHPDMGREQGEVGKALGPHSKGQHGRGGSGGFEAHGQEDHLAIGMGAGDGQGLQRGGEQPHIRPLGPQGEQAGGRAARHPQHVAVGAEDHPGAPGQGQGGIDRGGGGDTHRAARAMD